MICRYWWAQQDNEKRMHWISWQTLASRKDKGGLGYRDLHIFNLAMLARQGWRLLIQPDTLCARVMQAKYYPDDRLLKTKVKDGISYIWRSILKGLELLKEGLIWRIEDGSSVNIREDLWISREVKPEVITQRNGSILTKVADLLNPGTGNWDTH